MQETPIPDYIGNMHTRKLIGSLAYMGISTSYD